MWKKYKKKSERNTVTADQDFFCTRIKSSLSTHIYHIRELKDDGLRGALFLSSLILIEKRRSLSVIRLNMYTYLVTTLNGI